MIASKKAQEEGGHGATFWIIVGIALIVIFIVVMSIFSSSVAESAESAWDFLFGWLK